MKITIGTSHHRQIVALATLAALALLTSQAHAGDNDGLAGRTLRVCSVAGDVDGINGWTHRMSGDADTVGGRRIALFPFTISNDVPGDRDGTGGYLDRASAGDGDNVGGILVLPLVCGDQEGICGYASLLYWSPGWLR